MYVIIRICLFYNESDFLLDLPLLWWYMLDRGLSGESLYQLDYRLLLFHIGISRMMANKFSKYPSYRFRIYKP